MTAAKLTTKNETIELTQVEYDAIQQAADRQEWRADHRGESHGTPLRKQVAIIREFLKRARIVPTTE